MLSFVDSAIIIVYLVAIVTVGVIVGRQERNVKDFVVGGRRVPWIAILFSIIATEISAATFLGTPAVGFSENFNYLQFSIGSILGRVFVAFVFLTAFYALHCYTVYQYLQYRFGDKTRSCAVLIFLATRVLASSLRLLIASSAFSVLFNTPFLITLLLFTLTAVIYTTVGGIKAIIWTDVIQACVFIAAGVAVILYLLHMVAWDQIWDIARQAGKLEVFHWTPTHSGDGGISGWFSDPMLFYLVILNGFLSRQQLLVRIRI